MEDFRIKIANTEYASVEIVPTEDGVEIVVKRREKKEKKPENSNYEILHNFYLKMQGEDGVDQGELDRFWRFYGVKMLEWENVVKPDVLWKKWQGTKKK